ncbi:MAG: TetR/AcrR family transcriptional regulator [Lachnospiraceae bacterium]|jgi:AcrR family transcriptional regulator|nr:TetR/AcrR family transcriptional regulator [Lachnospiraceae bacterium]
MGKVEENKKKKKDAIVNSAFSLFINNGINDTSIADIMKKAELAKGTFYLYFKDKYEVRDYLIRRKATQVFERAIEDLEASDIEEFDDKIIFIIDNVLDQLDDNKILLKFIFKNLSWGLFRHSMEHVQVYDSDGQIDIIGKFNELTDGKIRNVEMLLFLIVELVSSTAYSVILFKQPVELPELKKELYPVIRQMIQSYTIVD